VAGGDGEEDKSAKETGGVELLITFRGEYRKKGRRRKTCSIRRRTKKGKPEGWKDAFTARSQSEGLKREKLSMRSPWLAKSSKADS